MLHAHFTAFCGIDAELLGWNFYTAWKRIHADIHCECTCHGPFWVVSLTRCPSYTNLTRNAGCADMNLLCEVFWKLSSERQIIIQNWPKSQR